MGEEHILESIRKMGQNFQDIFALFLFFYIGIKTSYYVLERCQNNHVIFDKCRNIDTLQNHLIYLIVCFILRKKMVMLTYLPVLSQNVLIVNML